MGSCLLLLHPAQRGSSSPEEENLSGKKLKNPELCSNKAKHCTEDKTKVNLNLQQIIKKNL